MSNSGEVLRKFYSAVARKDIAAASFLNDDLLFLGLFETYHNAEEYIAALTKLLQVVVRLDVKRIIAEGNDVAVFFELETKAPVAATTLVAEWHQVKTERSTMSSRPLTADHSRPCSPAGRGPNPTIDGHELRSEPELRK